MGAFFWKIQIRNSESKNGSWLHKIHTQGGFFGSNPNPDFWDSQSERVFFGKSIWKKYFCQGVIRKKKNGKQQMPYICDILTEPMLMAPY